MRNQKDTSQSQGKINTDSDDYLTCGRCLKEFPLKKITNFIEHKKLDCETQQDEERPDSGLLCTSCPQSFMTAVGLLKHAQLAHNLQLFFKRGSYAAGVLQDDQDIGVQSTCTQVAVDPTLIQTAVFTKEERFIPLPTTAIPAKHSSNQNLTITTNEMAGTDVLTNVMLEQNVSSVPLLARNTAVKLTPAKEVGNKIKTTADHKHRTESDASVPLYPKECKQNPPQHGFQTIADKKGSSTIYSNSQNVSMLSIANLGKDQESTDTACSNKDFVNEQISTCTSVSETREITASEKSSINAESHSYDSIPDGTENTENKTCCTNQKCGVTVIPGTHESLKKCCYAVAPKKRKRHMEIKHVPKYWFSRFSRRKTFSSSSTIDNRPQRPSSRPTGTIYIDLEPETGLVKTSHTSDASQSRSTRMTSIGNSQNFDFQVSGMQRENYPVGTALGKKLSRGSIILGPGTSFSIPVSYTIPTQSTSAPLQSKNLDSTGIKHSGSDVPESSNLEVSSATFVKEGSLSSKNATALVQTSSVTLETPTSLTNETSDIQILGVDVDSLVSMALSQTAVEHKIDTESGNQDRDAGQMMDIDTRQNRKRRYPTSKPFKCDQCEHAFNQRIHLKKHMSKHTGIKPFKCQQCDYSTVERSHLKVHIRIHTGEKPFKCTYCEYATAQNSTLKIHLKRHHGRQAVADDTETEECSVCKKRVPRERIQSHISHHQEATQSTQSNTDDKDSHTSCDKQ